MERQRKIFIGKTIAILSVVPILIYAHSAGPDPGKSGVPGESTCAESGCHTGAGLNQGPGSVTIDAGGTSYAPGVKQRIKVTVSDPAQRKWGFQLTARLSSNNKTRAGILAAIDGNTQVLCSTANLIESPCNANPPLQFIEHTATGARLTAVGAGLTFEFDWTPPATDSGPVILYAAGNAANGNMIESGDNIYTKTLTLTAGSGGGGGPTISSVVNGASFQPGFSGNSWVSILGAGLGTASSRTWQASDFRGSQLPTGLEGTTVTINNKPAFVEYVSPTIVNVLSPVDTSQGPVSVQLSYNGASATSTAQMQQFTPAFFIFNNDKYIASRHADFSLLGPTSLFPGASTPAKPGEVILLFGTGFGPTSPAITNGQVLTGAPALTNAVTVQIGGVAVTPSFAGLSATGLYQINVQVPAAAPNGDVPVVATIGGVSSPATAFISVQR